MRIFNGMLILLIGLTLLSSQSNAEINDFGFAGVDCGIQLADSPDTTNYIDEVAGFSTIAQLCIFGPKNKLKERLKIFKQHRVYASLSIESLFFEQFEDVALSNQVKTELRADALQRWKTFVDINAEFLTKQFVHSFYVIDEPFLNNLDFEDLELVISWIKQDVPEIPTLIIEGSDALDRLQVPVQVDLIGFDNYDSVDPENDPVWQSQLSQLKSAMSSEHQKIMIVASTQWLSYYESDAGVVPEDMEAIFQSYVRVASSDLQVSGLIGYIWPGGLDTETQLGARDLPLNSQQAYQNVFCDIWNKSPDKVGRLVCY